MELMLETRDLTKNYGKVRAVRKVSLCVRKGEIYGFLGLNGAGKTTTIRMLLGMIRPSEGAAFISGKKVRPDMGELWNRVGHLVEIPYSYPDLTVRENLNMYRVLRGIRDGKAVDAVIEKLKLGEYRNRTVRKLSLGNAQRLGLARALLHNPDILILDEPANGLDPAGIVEIRGMLSRLAAEQGVTVFISSHILGEISKFATRIGIVHEGRLLHEADTDKLDASRRRALRLRTRDNTRAAGVLGKNGFTATRLEGDVLEITAVDAIARPEAVNELLVGAGCAPAMLTVWEEDLETYFLRIIGEDGGAQ